MAEEVVFDLESLLDRSWGDCQDAFASNDRVDVICAIRGLRAACNAALDYIYDGTI